MALAYRQTPAASQSVGTVTSFSVTKQTGTASGDWIFIFLFGTNSTTVACTGFTVLNDVNSFACLLYRLADGTEGSSFSITGIATERVSAIIATVSGAATTLDALTSPNSGGASTNIAINSITLHNTNDWVLWFGADQNGFNNASFTITAPSGFTSRASIAAQTSNPAIMLADNTSLGSGATGTKTGTCTSSAFWSGVMIGISPAPATISGAATLSGTGSAGTPASRQLPAATLGAKGSLAPPATQQSTGTVLAAAGSITGTPAVRPPVVTFPGRPPNALGIKTELNVGGVWTDISQYVMLRNFINITNQGRTDESASITSAVMTLTLKNTDGRFTPKNAAGAYYPNIVRNAQIRVSVNAVSTTGVAYSGYRFYGEISSWPPGYDVSQHDIYVDITASGIWRRIQSSPIPIGSCFWRYVNLLTGSAVPAAYWAMEDGSGSTAFVLSEGTGTNMTAQGGTPSFAADGTSFPGSNALPAANGARLAANVTMASTPATYAVRFALSVPAAGDSTATGFAASDMVKILTGGTVANVTIQITNTNQLQVFGFNSGGTQLFTGKINTKVNGLPVLVSYEQTGGAYALKIIKAGGSGVLDQVTQSGFSWTVGKVTQVQVSPMGRLNDTTLGQMQVFGTTAVDIVLAANNLGGRAGEQAGDRFARLCTESSIPFTQIGSGGAALGPQVSDTMANVLQSIEDSDGGILFESRDSFGLGYRVQAALKDQAVALVVNYTSGALGDVLTPVYDDQLVHNQWTLTNYDGYSVTAQLNSGAMSIQPPPNGVGQGYAASKSVSLSTHAAVNALASQLLSQGCIDEVRYPTVVFNFQRAAAAGLFSAIPSLRIGDYFQISNLPAFLGGGSVKQLAWGYGEVLGGEVPAWEITFNTIPELPYESSFSPGTATVAQGPAGGVAAGSSVSGSSVLSGAQIGVGAVGTGELANTVTARKVGGTTSYVSAVTPFDWSFAVTGTPADATYFTCTQDQAQGISPGDTFVSTAGLGGPFTVTSLDPPSGGNVNVHFTPDATGVMSAGTLQGGKNGDLWINTGQDNRLYQWNNGGWTAYAFGPNAMSFSVGGVQVTFSGTAPGSPRTGDLWYNASAGYQLNQWNGTSWVGYQFGTQSISAGAIISQHIAAGTVVAGIVNGTTVEGVYFIAGAGGGNNWQAAQPTVPGFFMYYDDGVANPELIFSVSAGTGTDQWGNTWQGGATFVGLAALLNVLSVEDTTGNILAAIDYQGNIIGQIINATVDLQLAGQSVTSLFDDAPQGLITRGWITASSASTWPSTAIGTSATAIQELDVTVPANRKYELQVTPGTVVITTGPTGNTQIVWRLFYTTDGTTPSTASTEVTGHSTQIIPAFATTVLNYPTPYMSWIMPTVGSDTTYRVLLTGHIQSGAFKFSNIVEMRFVDWGVDNGQFGNNGVVLGSGTSGGGGGLQTYNKTYTPLHTYTYYGPTAAHGFPANGQRSADSNMWCSCTYTPDRAFYEGDQYSFAMFDYATIASDVGAGTINYAKLRLTNKGSFYSSGMNVICGWTTYTGAFGSTFIPGGGTHENAEIWTIGQGATLDHTLGSWWANTAFPGGWTGFIFGPAFANDGYTDQHNYGYFAGHDGTSSTVPRLTVNYTK